MKRRFLVLAAVIISSKLQAQDTTSTKQLDEVIVTATRTELKQSQTGKVVTVITQEMLQRNSGKTITEILNYQSGIFINGANNALGANQDIYFRGAGTGNVLILIDGAPVADASQINNSFDLNNLNTAQIERIEILKGAQSTLWGSDAVAGVINIITKKASNKKLSPSAALAFGSYNTIRLNAGVSGRIEKFSYNLNYGYTDSKGFSTAYDSTGINNFDKDGYKQNNLLAAIGYQFSKRFSAKYTANYSKYTAGIDAGAFNDDKDYTSENNNLTNGLGLQYKTDKLNLNLVQTVTSAKRLLNDDSISVGGFSKWAEAVYKGITNVTDLYGSFQLSKLFSIVAGTQYLAQNTQQSYKSISSFGPFNSVPLGKDSTKASNFSAYASLLLINANGFNAEAGFRFNNHNIYGSNATYSFNPSYNIDENTRVFVNISSGYKVPSLYQLYSEYGNKNLNPEKSNNYEAGLQTLSNNKQNSFRITGFKRDIKDLIIFYTDANFNSYYINRDEQHDYGFELESSIAIGKKGSWTNNFTYVDGEGKNNSVKVKNLYRRPNFTVNSVLTLQPVKGLTVMPSFRFVGNRLKGQFDAGAAQMPQYYAIDFYAGYEFAKHIRVFADFRNTTNQKYFDVPGFNSRGSNFMLGISANF
jgi:vitamin B12 transporter